MGFFNDLVVLKKIGKYVNMSHWVILDFFNNKIRGDYWRQIKTTIVYKIKHFFKKLRNWIFKN